MIGRVFVVTLVLVTTALMQTSLVPFLALGGYRPDLLLLITIAFAVEDGLLPGLRIAALTPVVNPPAPSRTNVKKPQRGQSEEPQFSSTQLVTNQRIATTAVARTSALIERIESGLDACSFVPGSLTGNDLTPSSQAA